MLIIPPVTRTRSRHDGARSGAWMPGTGGLTTSSGEGFINVCSSHAHVGFLRFGMLRAFNPRATGGAYGGRVTARQWLDPRPAAALARVASCGVRFASGEAAGEEQDEHDDENDSQNPARAVAPAAAVWPARDDADK